MIRAFPWTALKSTTRLKGTFWSGADSLATARTLFTAKRLNDGRVLVAGGWGILGALDTAEIYTPNSNSWAPTGVLTYRALRPYGQPPELGRVLVVGGA